MKKVWIIDPSQTVRTILAHALAHAGIESECFVGGVAGIAALHRHMDAVPGLLILEVRLPDLDGYDVVMYARSKLAREQTAIVVLSRCYGVLDRLKGRLAGADAYLTKPFKLEDVLAVVEQYLKGDDGRCGCPPAYTGGWEAADPHLARKAVSRQEPVGKAVG
jgi:twitching motility two-component system response regulator PilG